MAGTFSLKKFSDIDLSDPFFDSLKADYPVGGNVKPFEVWFPEKAKEGRTALVFDDENGLGAFVCIKAETENIVLKDTTLPKKLAVKLRPSKLQSGFVDSVLAKALSALFFGNGRIWAGKTFM